MPHITERRRTHDGVIIALEGFFMDLLSQLHRMELRRTKEMEKFMKDFNDLKTSVTRMTSASKSILLVLQTIVDKLKAAETIQDFEAVTAELDANTQELTDAAVANTPPRRRLRSSDD